MTKHNTAIEWTHVPGYKGETWNPIVGCSIVSPGCKNCYAMRMAARLQAMEASGSVQIPHYADLTKKVNGKPVWTGRVTKAPEKTLTAPLRWKKPRAIFVNSMGDLFHEDVPDEWINEIFYIMNLTPRHIYIILTKRTARMREYMSRMAPQYRVKTERLNVIFGSESIAASARLRAMSYEQPWPLPNVWLGTSVEDQKRADERIDHLKNTPAAIRLISAEPLIGQVNNLNLDGLDWVIAGGESGPGARPMHPDWVRSLRDQCKAAAVPFFFKQWGEWCPGTNRIKDDPFFYFQNGQAIDGHNITDDTPQWLLNEYLNQDLAKWIEEDGDPDTMPPTYIFHRIGKARAGRLLDGVEHSTFPKCVEETPRPKGGKADRPPRVRARRRPCVSTNSRETDK